LFGRSEPDSAVESPYTLQSFKSLRHPGRRSKASVAALALARPIGFCMLPVMIAALITMLQGYPALHFVTVGFPIAAAVALAWTWIQVRSVVVEIHIQGPHVAFRTLFDAATPPSVSSWHHIINVEQEPERTIVTLGLDSTVLYPEEWADWTEVVAALHSGYMASQS